MGAESYGSMEAMRPDRLQCADVAERAISKRLNKRELRVRYAQFTVYV